MLLIKDILLKNSTKNFVKRILRPSFYPTLENDDGSVSTHSMAYGEAGGRFYVYPTVVQTGAELVRLNDEEAWIYSQKTGEFIEFNNEESARWFSKNYKNVWDDETN